MKNKAITIIAKMTESEFLAFMQKVLKARAGIIKKKAPAEPWTAHSRN